LFSQDGDYPDIYFFDVKGSLKTSITLIYVS